MAHVSKSGSVLLLVGIALTALAFTPSAARATDCTPQYITLSENGPQVLIGCCNANGTWKTGTSSQRECINPANMCQRGHCDGNPNSTCNGSYTNAGGDCVVDDNQFCSLGECQQQLCTANSDPDLIPARCDDHNDCTSDSCSGSTYTTPSCGHSNQTGTDCVLTPSQTCKKGQCSSGSCTAVGDPDQFCGTVSGNTCSPKHCDANGDCISDGADIICPNDPLPVCKKWACDFNAQNQPVCSQVKVDPNNPAENSCDTDAHDCKNQKCTSKGKCGSQAQPVNTVCDSNFASPLADCYAGRCDSRKNCENEQVGISGYYDGQTCQSDSDVCTVQTCSGLACNVTSCNDSSTACGGCSNTGHCTGTAPSCTCVQ